MNEVSGSSSLPSKPNGCKGKGKGGKAFGKIEAAKQEVEEEEEQDGDFLEGVVKNWNDEKGYGFIL